MSCRLQVAGNNIKWQIGKGSCDALAQEHQAGLKYYLLIISTDINSDINSMNSDLNASKQRSNVTSTFF